MSIGRRWADGGKRRAGRGGRRHCNSCLCRGGGGGGGVVLLFPAATLFCASKYRPSANVFFPRFFLFFFKNQQQCAQCWESSGETERPACKSVAGTCCDVVRRGRCLGRGVVVVVTGAVPGGSGMDGESEIRKGGQGQLGIDVGWPLTHGCSGQSGVAPSPPTVHSPSQGAAMNSMGTVGRLPCRVE